MLKKIRKKYQLIIAVLAVAITLFSALNQFIREYQLGETLGSTDERGFENAMVAEVIDGDTIKLSDGRTVRYIGIDTPETKHPRKGQECFGEEASRYNEELVAGEIIQLEKDVSETDRYDRLLRYVWIDDVLINEKLVEDGYALATSWPPDVKREEEFRQAEQNARFENRGLWDNCLQE